MPKWIKYPLIGGAVVLVPVLGLILGIAIYALLQPIVPPPSNVDLKELTAQIAGLATKDVRATTGTLNVADHLSTGTAGSSADGHQLVSTSVRWPEFGVAEDNTTRIRQQYDDLLKAIVDYDNRRQGMDWNAKHAALDAIADGFRGLSFSLDQIVRWNQGRTDPIASADAYYARAAARGIDLKALEQVGKWIDAALAELIENTDPRGEAWNWKYGALCYESMMGARIGGFAWSPMDPWEREVYYWRKFGGLEGHGRIATRAIERRYGTFLGWLKKSPEGSNLAERLPSRLNLN